LVSVLLWLNLILPYQGEHVRITVEMPEPTHHYYQVEILFPASSATKRQILMPVWTPGSYKVRDYAKNIEGFIALDLNNTPLPWQKLDKSAWEIQTTANQPFKVLYRLFAYEYTVRTSYLDSFFGFINPASAFFYEKDKTEIPYRVRIVEPENWTVAVPLPKQGAQTYIADHWHQLVDTPMLFGPLRIHEFQVNDIAHRWVIAGEPNINETGAIESLKKIAEVTGELFGSYPFNRYFFLSAFQPNGRGGGLEHRNNTLVTYDGLNLRNEKGWDRFLSLMIHEYFHAWNVKSIRDSVLINPDYQKETYTTLLWVHEGWTSYYDTQLMARAGFWKPKRLLKAWGERITSYRDTPGKAEESLADASFNAWIHQYQPTRARKNAHISYYSVGELSALCLDLFIRQQTRNKVGLDHVLIQLNQDYAQQGEGISQEKIMDVLNNLVGFIATNFVTEYVLSPKPLPLEQTLGYAGLSIVEDDKEDKEKDKSFEPKPKVSLGITTKVDQGRVFVRDVHRGEAGWKAGLDYDDEILAINERRVHGDNFEKILAWSHPGDQVNVLISRAEVIKNITVKLAPKPRKLKLKKIESPTQLQQDIYASVFNPLGVEEKPDKDDQGDSSENE